MEDYKVYATNKFDNKKVTDHVATFKNLEEAAFFVEAKFKYDYTVFVVKKDNSIVFELSGLEE